MFTFRLTKSLAITAIISANFAFSVAAIQAQHATDFAIFSTDDVALETYSVVGGDIYSGRNLDIKFGYGIQVPSLNAGNMYARGNYLQELGSDVNGSVFVNGNATLEANADITENLTYGEVLTGSVGNVSGTILRQANTVGEIALPPATPFSAGTVDVVTDASITLAPGSYRNLQLTRSFKQIILTSGNYYLRQLDFATGTTVSLQIVNDEPINVFLEGDADFGTGLNFLVNGVEIGTPLADSVANLASLVMFECHGDFIVASGFLNEFFGTVFVPDGNVNVDLQNMHGSIISGRPVSQRYIWTFNLRNTSAHRLCRF